VWTVVEGERDLSHGMSDTSVTLRPWARGTRWTPCRLLGQGGELSGSAFARVPDL
jgi:hypothetical protein